MLSKAQQHRPTDRSVRDPDRTLHQRAQGCACLLAESLGLILQPPQLGSKPLYFFLMYGKHRKHNPLMVAQHVANMDKGVT